MKYYIIPMDHDFKCPGRGVGCSMCRFGKDGWNDICPWPGALEARNVAESSPKEATDE